MSVCTPCRKEGISTAAHRIVNGVPMCDACFRNRGELGITSQPREVMNVREEEPASEEELDLEGTDLPKPVEKRRRTMEKEINWEEVQAKRNKGVSVPQLVEEYDVSGPTIYNHTKAPKFKPGSAFEPKSSKAGKDVVESKSMGSMNSNIRVALAALRAKRDEIDAAISALEPFERD